MLLDHFGMYPERAFQKVGNRMTLEGGGKGSAPAAPDYTGAAQQTAAGNLATAQIGQYGNMVNQVTPQGSVTYTPSIQGYINTGGQHMSVDQYNAAQAAGQDVSGYNPLQQWTQTVTLSPEQQAAYNADVAMNAQLQNVASQGVDYVQQALNKPLSSPGQAVGNVATTQFTTNVNTPKLQTQVANAGPIQKQLERATIDVTGKIADAGQLQRSVNDPNLLQQEVTNALYNQQTQYLDPQFAQSQAKLENQLANQGITRGSEAWNNAIQEQARQKQQAYESARQSAIGQGVGAASSLFANQLAGGQFVNQAQGQQFGQNLSAAQLQNQANAQQVQNAMNYGQFANQAQQQQYNQNLSDMQAANQALQQQFGMGLSNAELANQAAQQTYAQGLSNAQLQNQAIQQNFGNAQTLQQQPINILNAVRSGAQMQSAQQPQVSVSQPGQLATVSGPDYLSAATATGQYNQGLYNAQQAANSGLTSGLFGLGSAGLMAYGLGK